MCSSRLPIRKRFHKQDIASKDYSEKLYPQTNLTLPFTKVGILAEQVGKTVPKCKIPIVVIVFIGEPTFLN